MLLAPFVVTTCFRKLFARNTKSLNLEFKILPLKQIQRKISIFTAAQVSLFYFDIFEAKRVEFIKEI